ncbi:hypothetical protein [Macrococcus brunensis]|nr:hypothetical protein [Macrococcus brunensis]
MSHLNCDKLSDAEHNENRLGCLVLTAIGLVGLLLLASIIAAVI